MFSSSMDSARDTSGVAGTGLIPMRFVWPYGGRSVYLSGSFTRWSELLQMSPVEGCPTVFQVIHSLAPGYHQVWLTDGTLSEVLPRISDVDVQTSRQRISAFLSMRTAYELLPESGKVVALDVDLPVKQAFHILHEQGIPMAPLWDFCKGQFVGVLSARDFILILREIGSHGSNLTEEELETHTISAWKEGKSYLNRQNNGPGAVFPRRFIHAGPYDNLKDIYRY
ncbi:hypothetical protein AAHE18_U009500 [Arachis hypogaea]